MTTAIKEDIDDRFAGIDIDTLLNRVDRRPRSYGKKKCLYEAPEFTRRLHGEETVMEGQSLCLDCSVIGFPAPSLRWFKDDEEILDHPRIHVESDGKGNYSLYINNVTKGDEAAYRCRAENVDGSSSCFFFLSVKSKPKSVRRKRDKHSSKKRSVSFPPMFATIVEKVEEEDKLGKEQEILPPSPLTQFYYALTLKGRQTWPSFLGEWAYRYVEVDNEDGNDEDRGADLMSNGHVPEEELKGHEYGRALQRRSQRRRELSARSEAKKRRMQEEEQARQRNKEEEEKRREEEEREKRRKEEKENEVKKREEALRQRRLRREQKAQEEHEAKLRQMEEERRETERRQKEKEEEELRLREEKRIEEETRKEEERKIEQERKKEEERQREARRQEEERKKEEEKIKEEKRRREEEQRKEEAKRREEERRKKELKRAEEEKIARRKEEMLQEEQRREGERREEIKKKEEERKRLEKMKTEEETRRREVENRRLEEEREKKVAEEKRKEEEKLKKEEEKRRKEEKRKDLTHKPRESDEDTGECVKSPAVNQKNVLQKFAKFLKEEDLEGRGKASKFVIPSHVNRSGTSVFAVAEKLKAKTAATRNEKATAGVQTAADKTKEQISTLRKSQENSTHKVNNESGTASLPDISDQDIPFTKQKLSLDSANDINDKTRAEVVKYETEAEVKLKNEEEKKKEKNKKEEEMRKEQDKRRKEEAMKREEEKKKQEEKRKKEEEKKRIEEERKKEEEKKRKEKERKLEEEAKKRKEEERKIEEEKKRKEEQRKNEEEKKRIEEERKKEEEKKRKEEERKLEEETKKREEERKKEEEKRKKAEERKKEEEKRNKEIELKKEEDLKEKIRVRQKEQEEAKLKQQKLKEQEDLRLKQLKQKEELKLKMKEEEKRMNEKKEKEEKEERLRRFMKEKIRQEQLQRQYEEEKRRKKEREEELERRKEQKIKEAEEKRREIAMRAEMEKDLFEVKIYKRDYSFADLRKSLETYGGGELLNPEEHKYWDEILEKHNYSISDLKSAFDLSSRTSVSSIQEPRTRMRRNSIEGDTSLKRMKRSGSLSDIRDAYTKSLDRSKKGKSDKKKKQKGEEIMKRSSSISDLKQIFATSSSSPSTTEASVDLSSQDVSSSETSVPSENPIVTAEACFSQPSAKLRQKPKAASSINPELSKLSVSVAAKRASFHEMVSQAQQRNAEDVAQLKERIKKRVSVHGFDSYGSREIPVYKRLSNWADEDDIQKSTPSSPLPSRSSSRPMSPNEDESGTDANKSTTSQKVRPFVYNSIRTIARKFNKKE